MDKVYSSALLEEIRADQVNELVGHNVYKNIAEMIKDQKNREILERIARDESAHYQVWM